jgi:site-specific DNA-cytosine methylase
MAAVGDVRLIPRDSRHPSVYRVVRVDNPAPCVTGTRFGSGALAIGDVRLPERDGRYHNKFQVLDFGHPATTVTGIQDVQAGAQSIGDIRLNLNDNAHKNLMRVTGWDETSGVVTGATRPAGGALSIAWPISMKSHRNGVFGVQDWNMPSGTVIGCLDVHSGAAAVGDPRMSFHSKEMWRIPDDNERGVWMIISLWNTWNRACTTFELAALQSFPLVLSDGRPLVLSGRSDSSRRERIGNAVPPKAAKAMGEQMLDSLLVAESGDWVLGSTGIWVIGGQEAAKDDCYGFTLDVQGLTPSVS